MTAAACGVLWALAAVAGMVAGRPARDRVGRELVAADPPSVRPSGGRAGVWVAGALGAAVAVPLWPPLLLAGVGGVLLARQWTRLRRRRARHAEVVDGLPEVIDLVALAATAGLTVPLTVTTLTQRAPPPYDAAFGAVAGRAERGWRLADALAELPAALGDPVRPLTAALVATERYGVPLVPALEHLGYDARRERRRRAEVAARRLPIRLCFPLVCCILPAFGLLTIAPLLAGALRSLRL